ncbi:MAG TPA: T9SS type A sorting domain-containing protein [Bacteroidales bacterium]|nr:T9SS type A sorting domain-containing protein [Bacteroidales bacterium]HOR81041.1 T9SS type A sorting domain-containing protein [Bacteroidales bacterium]HPJ91096.1 T9SS type A sorting domain-containing protein [Bacteroidales bacterium]
MKTKKLILILLLITQGAKGQFFDERSNWSIITTNLFDSTFSEISTFKVDGDTLIGVKTYFKIYKDNTFYCALRETEDHKIYCYFSDIQAELLTYDFDWEEGKELKYQPYEENGTYETYTTINQIDSIKLLDDIYYRCLKSNDTIFCIQGIGSLKGFFSFLFPQPTNGAQTSLLSFYKGQQLIYSNSEFNAIPDRCYSDNKVKVYPIPSNGNVTIELLDDDFINVNAINLYDESGKLIKSHKINGSRSININQLSLGIYFYQITSLKGQKKSGKIIITQ